MRRLSILAALASATPAFAQTPVEMSPVTVRGAPPGALTVRGVEDARRQIQRTPGAVEIVPAEQYRDGRATTVKDVLDFVPGVFAQPKYGQEDARLSIRGSGLSRNFHLRGIRLLQDGVPVNAADLSGDFHEIEPLATRYVEVFKGGNGLQYGAATLGGAVNFVSPTGYDYPRLLARAEAGSFGTLRGQMASGGVHGKYDYFATPTWSTSDGYRQQSHQDYRRLNGNLGYRIDATTETRFFLSANNLDNKIPGSLTKQQALAQPTFAGAANIAGNYKRDVDSVRVANRTSFLLGGAEVTLGLYGVDKTLLHPIFQVIDDHVRDYGVYGRASGGADLFGWRDEWLFGAYLNSGTIDDRRYLNVGGARGAMTANTRQYANNVELYGENRLYVVPSTALVVGAQLAYAERRTKDLFLSDGNDSAEKTFTNVNPKIGLLWDVDPRWQVFANVSRSAEPPTFSELNPSAAPGFASLDAQTAWTAEIGTRGRRGRVGWDVALYHARVRDELQLFQQSNGSTLALNADRTIHRGLELGGTVDLARNLATASAASADRLALRLAYSFSDFRFDGDPTYGDNQLPGAPRHYLRSELRYSHPSGFHVAPNLEWVPQGYFIDNANTQKTDGYALVGLKAGWTMPNGLTLFLDGRNLTGKSYVSNTGVVPRATTANSNVYNPGDGRAVYAGVEFRW